MRTGSTVRKIGSWELAATAAMAISGWVHLAIAPAHFAHAPAHGLFFGVYGGIQMLWVAGALPILALGLRGRKRSPGRFPGGFRALGLCLGGGGVVLWLLTQALITPFADDAEPIDGATVVSKVAEIGVALCLAMAIARSPAPGTAQRTRPRLVGAVLWPLAAGLVLWGGGLFAETRLPGLRLQGEHGHDHDAHGAAHGEEETPTFAEYVSAAVRLTAALFDRPDFDWTLPPGFPTPRVPPDNPMSAAKVELGRHLFYDVRLSGNGRQSCASCHRQELAFSDGEKTARGSTGERHPRNSMALVNIAYNATLTWGHPHLETLEDQIPIPMFGTHPVELGISGHEAEVLDRLRREPRYAELFADAFPEQVEPIRLENAVKALASFTRTLISGDSPYDRFAYLGESEALSPAARRGLEMFLSEDFECHHCHGGFNFSTATVHATTAFAEKVFHNTGLYDLGAGAYPRGNRGVFEETQRAADMGRFRPPTLRNVAVTAPYMHDGSIATLEEVIETYAAGGRRIETGPYAGDGRRNPYKSGFVPGFPIREREKSDLLAFLHSLTDENFLGDPRFGDPFAEPRERRPPRGALVD